MPDDDDPFDFRETAAGLVQISYRGKVVTQLAGHPESMRKYFYRDLHSTLGSVREPSDGT